MLKRKNLVRKYHINLEGRGLRLILHRDYS
jgi:hypothetical protein